MYMFPCGQMSACVFCSPCWLLRQGLSLAWGSPIDLDELASKPQGYSYLYFPSAENTRMHHHIWFFMWVLGSELTPWCLHGKPFPD